MALYLKEAPVLFRLHPQTSWSFPALISQPFPPPPFPTSDWGDLATLGSKTQIMNS